MLNIILISHKNDNPIPKRKILSLENHRVQRNMACSREMTLKAVNDFSVFGNRKQQYFMLVKDTITKPVHYS